VRAEVVEKKVRPPLRATSNKLTDRILESDRIATRRSILIAISLIFLWYEKYGPVRYQFRASGGDGISSWVTSH